MAGLRTIKIGTIFNLSDDACFVEDSSKLFDRFGSTFYRRCFGKGNTRVKVVEIRTRPNLHFKVQSARDHSKCGYVKIAGMRGSKVTSIEVIDDSIPDPKPSAPLQPAYESI